MSEFINNQALRQVELKRLIMKLHDGASVEDGHPVHTFKKENRVIDAVNKLLTIEKHYRRSYTGRNQCNI